jgi:CubicO group peptidase (beta-lactamase class C family)
MFKKVFVSLTAVSLLAANVCFAMDNGEKQELHDELTQMIGDTGTKVPGMGVIVYKDGKEVFSDFLGTAIVDSENPQNNRPFTRESRFRVASVSKMFTVFTLMQLQEQGKLDLDADVSQYLGFKLRNPQYPEQPITARMLASHTSSLRDGKVYSIPPQVSVQEFFKPEGKFYENGAHFAPQGEEPGKYFAYCNLNYGILGTIIEKVTGERFDKYQKNHILRQLDIQADYLPGNFSKKEFAKLGAVYQKKDTAGKWNEHGPWRATQDGYPDGQPQKDTVALQNPYKEDYQDTYSLKGYVPGTNATVFSPAGGLRISCDELSHALSMLADNGTYRGKQVLSPASVQAMMSRQWIYDAAAKNGKTYGGTILSYGLGIYQMDGDSTARFCKDAEIDLVGHTGEAFGLLSMLCLRPNTKDGYIYIMNGEAVEEDEDERSAGKFSNNYIWEERLGDAICRHAFSK